ncbi:scavenger receptor cysteine-rich type 1 protein M130-like [Acanthaster planci]|uniref:Scavenger receptor cysteine-rich type 1 protein M130-like n=1 Tax=Acanthaster planci TaxID=133434 RepID=A0A8B7XRN0_ACAPL|nr:scavenger receptor cysteine-rich type 1 protein M130-like [Acanthaster planci]
MNLAQCLCGLTILISVSLSFSEASAVDVIRLRLVDGRYPNEGRLEVLPPGEVTWGSYCSNSNPFQTGRVACRQLGFPALFLATSTGQFGRATGPIWFEEISCKTWDLEPATLDGCRSVEWLPRYDVCDHRFDVGITCFTGNLRLVGGKRETEGRVELHLGGDKWVLLAYPRGLTFMYSDTVCRHLGYPFSVGATEEVAITNSSQEMLCAFSHCPLFVQQESRDFFDCLDHQSLKLCPDKNRTLFGVVCATENAMIPSNASMEFRLVDVANASRYRGIVEARYNGFSWKTVCFQLVTDLRAKLVADEACQSLGYPWASASELIYYSESPGYVSTGDELVLRELYLGSTIGELRWIQGQNTCQKHYYELLSVECETDTDLIGHKQRLQGDNVQLSQYARYFL